MRMTFLGVDVERVCICDFFLSPYLCFTVKKQNKTSKRKQIEKKSHWTIFESLLKDILLEMKCAICKSCTYRDFIFYKSNN